MAMKYTPCGDFAVMAMEYTPCEDFYAMNKKVSQTGRHNKETMIKKDTVWYQQRCHTVSFCGFSAI